MRGWLKEGRRGGGFSTAAALMEPALRAFDGGQEAGRGVGAGLNGRPEERRHGQRDAQCDGQADDHELTTLHSTLHPAVVLLGLLRVADASGVRRLGSLVMSSQITTPIAMDMISTSDTSRRRTTAGWTG
jgi:hypothetical protein